MAMLMMPERSHNSPHMAPSVRGVDAVNVAWIIPGRLRFLPLVIHTRKAKAARRARTRLSTERTEARP